MRYVLVLLFALAGGAWAEDVSVSPLAEAASTWVLTAIAAVIGAVWTWFKNKNFRATAESDRYQKALLALEAGVELTYRTYVRAIKESREDGKLTNEEMRLARRSARDAAIEFGKTKGVDVLRELGGDYIDLLIAKIVKSMKGQKATTTRPKAGEGGDQ